jgi:predicted dehydrogenase
MDILNQEPLSNSVASWGLIGAGGIGASHLASLQRLEQRGLVRLAAVADPAVERFASLKRELESRGVRWYVSYRDMLNDEGELEAVTIATPIPLHYAMTLACLERDVFINLEKPPVPLLQQLDVLIKADPLRRVTVGFQMIVSRGVQRLKHLLAAGTIGEIRSIRAGGCWPRHDSYYQRADWAGKMVLNDNPVFDGPATNALAHLIHNIMFLAEPSLHDFAVPTEVQGELYRARPIESYDIACLRGKFASGADFSVAVTHATREAMPFLLEVRGTDGWLRLSEDGAKLEASTGEVLNCLDTLPELLDLCYGRFLEAMRDKTRRTYTCLEDTRGYVATTNGLLRSSGGIQDIAPAYISRYEKGGEVGYDVVGLRAAVGQAVAGGLLFSELGLQWARATSVPVRLDSFEQITLSAERTSRRGGQE